MKAQLKIIASLSRALAEQCDAASESETVTDVTVNMVRRSYLALRNAAGEVFTKKRK